jgi:hypothetical protein
MRMSPVLRGARPPVLATLILFLALSPSYARMGGGSAGGSFARPGFGSGHFHHFAPGGFNRRSDFGRMGSSRLSPNRFGNPLLIGASGWDGWADYSAPAAASEPIIVGDGPPVIINIGVEPPASDPASADAGGCVIHKLNYDSNGKYVGERQIPLC